MAKLVSILAIQKARIWEINLEKLVFLQNWLISYSPLNKDKNKMTLHVQQTPNPDAHDPAFTPLLLEHSSL